MAYGITHIYTLNIS